jgi:hypothetical protein
VRSKGTVGFLGKRTKRGGAISSCVSIERWRHNLLQIIGCSPDEVSQRVDALLQFCAGEGISPEQMIEHCRDGRDRIECRNYYLSRTSGAGLKRVVESFLIHNGVNIFGDLICVPSTTEALAKEQGTQWSSPVRADGRSPGGSDGIE